MDTPVYPRLTHDGTPPSSILEVAFAPGPKIEGDTGSGLSGMEQYIHLYGYAWLLVLDKDGALLLYQATVNGNPWRLGAGPAPASWTLRSTITLQHSTSDVRHIALAFDQVARPMVAYERNGEVWVRQWDPVTHTYVYRGPFSGHDPVLVCDASIMYKVPDSDVLLFYLKPGRKDVVARIQRDLYGVEYSIGTLPEPSYLDQLVQFPYRVALIASNANVPTAVSYKLVSDLYPVNVHDRGTVSGQPVEALHALATLRAESGEVPLLVGVASHNVAYHPAVVFRTQTEGVSVTPTPRPAIYAPSLIAHTRSEPAMLVTPTPQPALYAFAAIRYAATEPAMQVSATPLSVVYYA